MGKTPRVVKVTVGAQSIATAESTKLLEQPRFVIFLMTPVYSTVFKLCVRCVAFVRRVS